MQDLTTNFIEEEAPERSRSRRNYWGWLCVLLLCAAVGLTSYLSLQGRRFAPGTTISGVDCAGLHVDDAHVKLLLAAGEQEIVLSAGDGTELGETTLLSLTDSVDYAAQVAAIQAQQKSERGFFLRRPCTTDFALDLSVETDTLEPLVEAVVCGEGYVAEAPQDAQLIIDDQGVHIQPETTGNLRDLSACTGAVAAYLRDAAVIDAEEPVTLRVENALLPAGITADDRDLKNRETLLSRYLDMELTLNFCGERSYTLTPTDILSLLDVTYTEHSVSIRVQEDAVAPFLARLVTDLGVDGVDAKYGNVAETREYVYYTVEDRGFLMDRQALCDGIIAALKKHENTELTAVYDYDWWLKENYSFMGSLDTVVEISIANQYLWFYCDGQLLTETPVTTGCIATGSYTNTGVFKISYVTADVFLTGPTWRYHVDYWIPFDGDIGLHDSYWREDYGGDVYLTDGSHGCVNTPPEPMGIIYNTIYQDSRWNTVVVVR